MAMTTLSKAPRAAECKVLLSHPVSPWLSAEVRAVHRESGLADT